MSAPASGGSGIATRLIAVACVVAMLYFGRAFFVTLISAVIITFILQPFVLWFMKIKLPRSIASFLVCSIFVLLVYFSGLGLATQATGLIDDLPGYGQKLGELIDGVADRLTELERSVSQMMPKKLQDPPPPPGLEAPKKGRRVRIAPPPPVDPNAPAPVQEVRIQPERSPLLSFLYARIETIYSVTLMASFVPFLVYFMLAWRDHLRSRFLSLFRGEMRNSAGEGWHRMADVARAYVLGNFFLGLLLGVASSIFFASVRLPYWLLIGPLSGFLSLVPYLGVPLAVMPPVMAALPVHTDPAMYVFITGVVALLHLLALNLVYPKFVGSRVHLNPLVVTLALMFWGTLWGGIGLLLAVPITAGIKAVCDSVESLRPYGKLLGD